MKPDWWFSAHLHVKYDAIFIHGGGLGVKPAPPPVVKNPEEIVIDDEDDVEETKDADPAAEETPTAPPRNPDEIMLDDEEEEVAPLPPPPPPPTETRFMALDKCIRGSRRQFLEVRDALQVLFPCLSSVRSSILLRLYHHQQCA